MSRKKTSADYTDYTDYTESFGIVIGIGQSSTVGRVKRCARAQLSTSAEMARKIEVESVKSA